MMFLQATMKKSLSARTVDVAVGKLYERPEVEGTVLNNTVSQSIAVNTVAVQPDEEPDHSPNSCIDSIGE